MPFPETVLIGSQPYLVYADVTSADLYLDAAIQADSWRLSTTTNDVKGRALVTATRVFERQFWRGEKFDPEQDLQFPRKNMGIAGLDDSLGVTPDAVVAGSIELALALVDGSDVQNQATTEETIRSITAGSVSITNFRGVGLGIGRGSRFPQIIQELIGPYLAGAGFSVGAKAVGVDQCSKFPGRYGFNQGV